MDWSLDRYCGLHFTFIKPSISKGGATPFIPCETLIGRVANPVGISIAVHDIVIDLFRLTEISWLSHDAFAQFVFNEECFDEQYFN